MDQKPPFQKSLLGSSECGQKKPPFVLRWVASLFIDFFTYLVLTFSARPT